MKLSVIIPAYNEEATIAKVIDKVRSVEINKEIIVVDDGSTDNTRSILKDINFPQVRVILKKKNEGKASAVRTGIEAASGDYIIIQDADLEYSPDDYPELLKPLKEGTADVIYGNRFPKGKKNFLFKSFVANKFLTGLTNILYGINIGDMETCYKVIPRKLALSLNLREENFDIEAEITAKLARRSQNIKSVPINYMGRSYGEGKKIGFKDFLRALKILFKYRFFT